MEGSTKGGYAFNFANQHQNRDSLKQLGGSALINQPLTSPLHHPIPLPPDSSCGELRNYSNFHSVVASRLQEAGI